MLMDVLCLAAPDHQTGINAMLVDGPQALIYYKGTEIWQYHVNI